MPLRLTISAVAATVFQYPANFDVWRVSNAGNMEYCDFRGATRVGAKNTGRGFKTATYYVSAPGKFPLRIHKKSIAYDIALHQRWW